MKHNWSFYILLTYLLAFLALGINSLIKWELVAHDRLGIALVFLIFILINRKIHFHPFIAVIIGLFFIPHEIGIWYFYSSSVLNGHYDWIAHFVSSFLGAIIIMNILLHSQYFSNRILITCMITFSVVLAFGVIWEISEYWGFRIFGFGEGYLGFGDGDNSQNFGPWENSSQDSSLNLIGSLLAVVLYGRLRRRKDENDIEGME